METKEKCQEGAKECVLGAFRNQDKVGVIAAAPEMKKQGAFGRREYMRRMYEKEFAEAGIKIIYFPYTQGVSSTKITEALKNTRGWTNDYSVKQTENTENKQQ